MIAMRVTVVRIYCTEGEHKLKQLMQRLHDQEQVRGVTVFRGISGFGKSGHIHASSLLDMSLDLPLVVEFFDRPQKVERVMKSLEGVLEPGHVLSWPADLNVSEDSNA
jgi:PII-like signaling protein